MRLFHDSPELPHQVLVLVYQRFVFLAVAFCLALKLFSCSFRVPPRFLRVSQIVSLTLQRRLTRPYPRFPLQTPRNRLFRRRFFLFTRGDDVR